MHTPVKQYALEISPHMERYIFEATPLIGQILTLFQDIHPEMNLTSPIWKVICLAAYLRNADQEQLVVFMERNGHHGFLFQTLVKCYINWRLSISGFQFIPDRSEPPVSVTIPYLHRIFPREGLPPVDYKNYRNIHGNNYLLQNNFLWMTGAWAESWKTFTCFYARIHQISFITIILTFMGCWPINRVWYFGDHRKSRPMVHCNPFEETLKHIRALAWWRGVLWRHCKQFILPKKRMVVRI